MDRNSHPGYKIDRKASKSLRSVLPSDSDMVIPVSLPLGSVGTELVCLARHSESRTAENVCMNSIKTMEAVLDITGGTLCLLPPKETICIVLRCGKVAME